MLHSIRSAIAAMAVALSLTTLAVPALARSTYVQDGASLFGSSTVDALNTKIGDFNRQTGKEVVVVTVPSLDGASISDAVEKAFATQQVNGVLIYLAKAEKKDAVVGDRASRQFFPSGSFDAIQQSMRGSFRAGDYDGGITNGVNLVLNTYRGHESSLHGARHAYAGTSTNTASTGGGMSIFWLVLILIAGFLIIRAIVRAVSGPRVMPPGYGGGPGMPMGMGGPGYGYGGGGFGGGGGSFFSGLLGGLGGAFIGNELFGRRDEGGYAGDQSGFVGGDSGSVADSSGWQSDAGQADMGNASFGDFGGGGDSGGGGGDSGGGW